MRRITRPPSETSGHSPPAVAKEWDGNNLPAFATGARRGSPDHAVCLTEGLSCPGRGSETSGQPGGKVGDLATVRSQACGKVGRPWHRSLTLPQETRLSESAGKPKPRRQRDDSLQTAVVIVSSTPDCANLVRIEASALASMARIASVTIATRQCRCKSPSTAARTQ